MREADDSAAPAEVSAPFPAVETVAGDFRGGLVLLCDHAAAAVPAEYGSLGLPAAEFGRHIAYDIGAAALTRALAARLQAPAVLSCFSRLLIDPNRGEDDPTLIMRLSDGAVVPGNARVDAGERDRRLARFYRPYHDAVATMIAASLAAGEVPAILSLHSFTPVWKGVPRPWHAGILWDADPRMALPLIAALAADPGLAVGDNEPYSGTLKNDTLYRHATAPGLANALIEVRQDLIADAAGVAAWAVRLEPILRRLMALPEMRRVEPHGSHADP